LLAAALPLTALGAGTLSRPVLGYSFEPASKSIRPIAGVAGAAFLDNALPNASKIEIAFVAPGRSYAIAESLGAEASMLLRWDASGTYTVPLANAGTEAAMAAFSSGEFAAVYYRDSARIQIWRGLPDAPAMVREFAADDVQGLAISDDGTMVATISSAGLLVHTEWGSKLAAGGTFSSVIFLPGTHDAAVAEPSADRVLLAREGDANVTELASGIPEPLALAASRDGGRIAIAIGKGAMVLLDAQGKATTSTACDFAPREVTPLASGTAVLVTAKDGSRWVFDIDTGEPRLVFAGGAQ
jgi:hypothetical protein